MAKAASQIHRDKFVDLRQREQLADTSEILTKINHDIPDVVGSATLVTSAPIWSDDPKVQRATLHVAQPLEQAADL